jgi:hypothetical protein
MTNEASIEILKKQVFQENRATLRIARLPPDVLEAFKKLAEERYCQDYGWLFCDMWEKYHMYWDMKIKFDQIFSSTYAENKEVKTDVPKKVIKLLNGKTIEGGKHE